jgi:hypothetical protein
MKQMRQQQIPKLKKLMIRMTNFGLHGSFHLKFLICVLLNFSQCKITTSQSCTSGQGFGSGGCSNCVSGKYQDQNESSEPCKFCPAGKKFTSKTTVCTDCATGKYQEQNTLASAVCKTCAAGTEWATTATACSTCADTRTGQL